ncbi:MAG: hypothetical protein ACLQHF_05480 [Terracidiphilus sp.]
MRICSRDGCKMRLAPGGSDKLVFEIDVIGGTAGSILLDLALYWRGARSKQSQA